MSYEDMRSFLDANNVTHEQMDEKWELLKQTNRIVKNLADHGQKWTDLPIRLLEDMIARES